MIADSLGRLLHDRATRGEKLSTDEEVMLQSWYSHHDAGEAKATGIDDVNAVMGHLQANLRASLEQLKTTADEIAVLTAVNEGLRSENVALQSELAKQSVAARA